MGSRPDSSDRLEKRLPAGWPGKDRAGGGRGSSGSSREAGSEAASVQGSRGCQSPGTSRGGSLADSHVALWAGEEGIMVPRSRPSLGRRC